MFGNGIRVWTCHIDKNLFDRMNQLRKNQPWENVLIDYDFLNELGLSHWSELSESPELIGLKLDKSSSIEIKKKAKKLAKFCGTELVDQHFLFPQYQTCIEQLNEQRLVSARIIIIEHETGQTHGFEIAKNNVLMNELNFTLLNLDNEWYCSGILFRNTELISKRNDTVNRSIRILVNDN